MATAHNYVDISDARNQFTFECPIFDVTTKISSCFRLRELVWAGQRPDVRKGCQVCMQASKCPASAVISKKYPAGKKWQDDYTSDTPVLGKLRKDVLERVSRTLVVESFYRGYSLSDAERLKIETCQPRIEAMLAKAPEPSAGSGYSRPIITSEPREPRRKRSAANTTNPISPVSNAVNEAAASGDLATAINAAA